MKVILQEYGVLPKEGVTYQCFAPLRDKIRAGETLTSYENIYNLFYKWCVRTGDDISAICVCDDVPDRGVPIPVCTPFSLITYSLHRRGLKNEKVFFNGKPILDVISNEHIFCIKKWNALVNNDKFLSAIGSALHLRGVDVDKYQSACQECLSSNVPQCNHQNRSFKYPSGYARHSQSFSNFYDLVKFQTKDRISKGAKPITPFQLVKLSQAAWYSGDFYRVFIHTIFLHMVWGFGRAELTFTKIFGDIASSLGNSFCPGVNLDRVTFNFICKNRDQLFSMYANNTKMGGWICPLESMFYILACTKIRSGYIFPSKKSIRSWIDGGFVGVPDSSEPIFYSDFCEAMTVELKNVLGISGEIIYA